MREGAESGFAMIVADPTISAAAGLTFRTPLASTHAFFRSRCLRIGV